MSEPVALLLVVGAPGAGKSTLVARWLADPEVGQALAVVNELGEAAVEQHLGTGFASGSRRVAGGCGCCASLDALVATVEDAMSMKPPPARILVEVAGTADPMPLLERLDAVEGARVEGVVCIVDGVHGLPALERREGALQAMVADAIVVSRTDLATAEELERVETRLAQLNAWATLTRSADGNAHPQMVIAGVNAAAGREERRNRAASVAAEAGEHAAHEGIEVRTLRREPPIDAETLRSHLESFLDRRREDVLRIKGLVAIEGRPGPAVIQAASGSLDPIRLLPRWPEGASGALIVVSTGVPADEIEALLA